MSSRAWAATAGIVALAAAAVFLYGPVVKRGEVPTAPSREASEDLVRVFYVGLASLDTGLLEMAKTSFTRATELAPQEPAAWANLAVAHVRSAEFAAAAEAAGRAASLAPDDARIATMQAAIDASRGELDAAVESLRRALALDQDDAFARFALADALERAGGADADAQSQLERLLLADPDNLALIVERARLAAKRGDTAAVLDSVQRLEQQADLLPEIAMEQVADVRTAASAADLPTTQRSIAFLRNVLARVPSFQDGLAAVRVPAELVAYPLDRFVALAPVRPEPSAPDLELSYEQEQLSETAASRMLAWPIDLSDAVGLFAASGGQVRRLDTGGTVRAAGTAVLLPLDWNNDFRTDLLVGDERRLRLFLQDADGAFSDASARVRFDLRGRVLGAWIADLEMDGDIDLVVGVSGGPAAVFRNNGDGTSTRLQQFEEVRGVSGFAWSDIDGDGDPDPTLLDADGALHVFTNHQAGSFTPLAQFALSATALASADLNGDGILDLVVLDANGTVRRLSMAGGRWDVEQAAEWSGAPGGLTSGSRLVIGDYDNNGALDVLAAGGGSSQLWLGTGGGMLQALPATAGVEIFGAVDLNADGALDFVGIADGRPVRLLARTVRPYHWQTLRPQARTDAGDQRVNSFAVGGEVEIRSGLLAQKQLLTGAPVHVGLGSRTGVDVARIVWPNGVMQAEFDPMVDQTIVAEQRLKGSCPWVFADDGQGMEFVTDFLWRSPLGLRINAQDTAGVAQTEDWIRIRGDQLAPRDGRYDLRITAELWETHFFDHVSLMVVDHPPATEVFVDERFARTPPVQAVHTTHTPVPVAGAWDDTGQSQLQAIAALDGRHASGFERGAYQGVTREHTLELDLGPVAPSEGPLWLVAAGWVYPTDSSINVAIAQGQHPAPHGIGVDVRSVTGVWEPLHADIGFPAGKNKTMLVDLSGRPRGATRVRLRTNMEVYWDWIAWAIPAPVTPRTERLATASAELRFRGFSATAQDWTVHAPEIPRYDRLANVVPRWRDLTGYYTRFGDVAELLSAVDDRYVIMNAGDELRLSFAAPPPPPAGWRRDFVLIGDGWEKDGDFNTGFSQTVLPLPRHDDPAYTTESVELERDPAYLRHPDDWQRFHTRFVEPSRYLRGLTRSTPRKAPAPGSRRPH